MSNALDTITEGQREIQESVRQFARTVLEKTARKADEKQEFPLENLPKLAESGVFAIPFSEEYGGLGSDAVSFALAVKEIAYCCASTALTVAAHVGLACAPIYNFGNDEQKKKYVAKGASGEWIGSFCSTEPNVGSDVAGISTTAKRKDGGWVINGTKAFVTNAKFAKFFYVSAISDPDREKHKQVSTFIVEPSFGSVSIAKDEHKLGMRASSTCIVNFDEVFVPDTNLVGKRGEGFKYLMDTLNGGRITIAALSLGIMERARDIAVKYMGERKQFGKFLHEFQALQFMIADMEVAIQAATLLMLDAAKRKAAGKPFAKQAAIAKLYASDQATLACKNAIQILGGYGYMEEYDIERFYRDAKLCEIGEGTNEIQRIVIARHVLKEAGIEQR